MKVNDGLRALRTDNYSKQALNNQREYRKPLIWAIAFHVVVITLLFFHFKLLSPPNYAQQSHGTVINAVTVSNSQLQQWQSAQQAQQQQQEQQQKLVQQHLVQEKLAQQRLEQQKLAQQQAQQKAAELAQEKIVAEKALQVKQAEAKAEAIQVAQQKSAEKAAEAEAAKQAALLKQQQIAVQKAQQQAQQQALQKQQQKAAQALALQTEQQLVDDQKQQLQKEKKLAQQKLAAKEKQQQQQMAKNAVEQLMQQQTVTDAAQADSKTDNKTDSKSSDTTDKPAAAAMSVEQQGEFDKYKTLVQQSISQQWNISSDFDKNLEGKLLIRLAPGGVVLSTKIIKSSGDATLDDLTQKAVLKASPLPVPSDPALFDEFREIVLTFRPEGLMMAG